MMAGETLLELAKRKIAKRIDFYFCLRPDKEATPEQCADKILSIPELAVVDRDAELPKNPYDSPNYSHIVESIAFNCAIEIMLKAGYVKEIKKEDKPKGNSVGCGGDS